MKRNVVIFLIIIILFLLIALIGYFIYYLQTRMAVGGTASSVSDVTEV
jgi:exopolysaccharide biosynthesis protein